MEDLPVGIIYQVGWNAVPLWTSQRQDKTLFLSGIETPYTVQSAYSSEYTDWDVLNTMIIITIIILIPTFITNRQAQCKWLCSENSNLLCCTKLEIRLSLALSCGSSLRLDELYQWYDIRASHSPYRQTLPLGLCLNRKMKFPASPWCVLDPIVACYKEKAIKEPWLRDRRWSSDRCKLLLRHTAGEPIIMPTKCSLTNIWIHKLKQLLFFSHFVICQ